MHGNDEWKAVVLACLMLVVVFLTPVGMMEGAVDSRGLGDASSLILSTRDIALEIDVDDDLPRRPQAVDHLVWLIQTYACNSDVGQTIEFFSTDLDRSKDALRIADEQRDTFTSFKIVSLHIVYMSGMLERSKADDVAVTFGLSYKATTIIIFPEAFRSDPWIEEGVVTHEFGHLVLGPDHSDDPKDVMFWAFYKETGKTDFSQKEQAVLEQKNEC